MLSDKEHKNAIKNYLKARRKVIKLLNEEPPKDYCPLVDGINDWEVYHAQDLFDACVDIRNDLGPIITCLINEFEEIDNIMSANVNIRNTLHRQN